MEQLQALLRQRRAASKPVEHREHCASERPRRLVAAARAALGHARARLDLEVPTVDVAGERSQRVLRCVTPYHRAAGPVWVERRLSRHKDGSGRAVYPLERRAGMLEGAWPPLAATPGHGGGGASEAPRRGGTLWTPGHHDAGHKSADDLKVTLQASQKFLCIPVICDILDDGEWVLVVEHPVGFIIMSGRIVNRVSGIA